MKKNTPIKPSKGLLTNRMDAGTDEFNEFQTFLLDSSKERSNQQKRLVDLMALKFEMEDYLKSETQDVKSVGEFLKLYLKALQIHQKNSLVILDSILLI